MLYITSGVKKMLEDEFKKRMTVEATTDDFAEKEDLNMALATQSNPRNLARYGYNSDGEEDAVKRQKHTAWEPHNIMSTWENDDGIRCVSVIFALTGGTAHKTTDGITVELDDDGNTLCISEVWSLHCWLYI